MKRLLGTALLFGSLIAIPLSHSALATPKKVDLCMAECMAVECPKIGPECVKICLDECDIPPVIIKQ